MGVFGSSSLLAAVACSFVIAVIDADRGRIAIVVGAGMAHRKSESRHARHMSPFEFVWLIVAAGMAHRKSESRRPSHEFFGIRMAL